MGAGRPRFRGGRQPLARDAWSLDAVPALRQALDVFDGGRIAIVIAGGPYKCPPAPYECAMLLNDHLRERGVRGRSDLVVSTFQPMLFPNAGKDGSVWLGERLDERGVEWHVGRTVRRVEPGRVVFADGTLEADVLIGVPPHRPPAPYDGNGFCFIELGKSAASLVQGRFYASPEPKIELAEASADNAAAKRRFEAERLEEWFGH